MTPQMHEKGTRFIDIPDNDGYRIDFANLHEQTEKGDVIAPWLLSFTRERDAADRIAIDIPKPPTPAENISANTLGVVTKRRARLDAQGGPREYDA